ncbi:MAG: glycosyltransferase family 2 protein [Bryobacterales bacterium]|nr:glycosyltransferase family 2 protein [Acidobacteriota bacterium]MCB9384641.1 glycosyltransferase family 2 protein [Bryobacterales bacterium]
MDRPVSAAVDKKPTPRLSIVIVSWNTLSFLDPCLDSIYSVGLRFPFEILVVDNGSTDGTQERLRTRWPEVRLIQNVDNVGFAAGTNQGVAASQGDYALLLNPDTLVNAACLRSLVEFLDQTPNAAAAGGKLLNADGTFQASYSDFSTLWQEMMIASGLGAWIWRGYPSHHQPSKTIAADWITGACLIVRRDLYLQFGGLDEDYIMYSEEVDLQYRLKRSGWEIYYLPHVTTLHHGGGSQGRVRRRRMVYRGKLMFYCKNYGFLRQTGLRLMFAGAAVAKLAVWSLGWFLRSLRSRAKAEIRSNVEVLELCWKTGRTA